MKRPDLDAIHNLVATRLPPSYEPLRLTFYGRQCRRSGGDVVVGDDYGTELRVLADSGDGVYSVDPERRQPARFVNSSVEHLARFFGLDSEVRRRTPGGMDNKMWPELTEIDAAAFADPDNWWALIHEQVQHGLL